MLNVAPDGTHPQIASGKVDLSVNFARPVTLTLQFHAGHLYPLINGRFVGTAVPISPASQGPSDQVVGLFVDCTRAEVSAPVYVTGFELDRVQA